MSYTDPRINYVTVRNNILSLFENNKNDTYLNKNLTSGETFTSNDQIKAGDPDVKPVFQGLYPYIMLSFDGKVSEDINDEYGGLGAANTKVPILKFTAYAVTRIHKDSEDVEQEIMHIIDNIEALLRDNIGNVDGTLWVSPGASEKVAGKNGKGVYVAMAAIEIFAAVEVS